MKPEERIICDVISSFVDGHWDKINLEKAEIEKSKEDFLNEVNTNFQTAMWVLTELADWCMDKKYLKELFVPLEEECDFQVLKIKDKYFKMQWFGKTGIYKVNFVEPKTRTVTYFD